MSSTCAECPLGPSFAYTSPRRGTEAEAERGLAQNTIVCGIIDNVGIDGIDVQPEQFVVAKVEGEVVRASVLGLVVHVAKVEVLPGDTRVTITKSSIR